MPSVTMESGAIRRTESNSGSNEGNIGYLNPRLYGGIDIKG